MGCNCGGGGKQTGAQPQHRKRGEATPEPRVRRSGGPQDKGSGYYSGPRRNPKTSP